MDYFTLERIVPLANFVLTWALGFYVYLLNQGKVTNDRVSKLEETLNEKHEEHSSRLAVVETLAKGQISRTELAALYESVNALAATVNQLVGETKLQSECLRLMMNAMARRRAGDLE